MEKEIAEDEVDRLSIEQQSPTHCQTKPEKLLILGK
jgi:hypothetical protein